MSERTIIDLQEDLVARTLNDSYFQDITVLSDRKGDIVSAINNALGVMTTKSTKIGVCVIFFQPMASVELKDVPNALMEIHVTARVLENVIFNTSANGTGKPAQAIARRLARIHHWYRPMNIAQTLVCEQPTMFPVEDPLAPVAYEVKWQTQESDPDIYEKVAGVVISPTSGAHPQTITLSCATAGATIVYSTDGTYPRTAGTGTAYTVPFTMSAAGRVRAVASKAGMIDSDVNSAIFT